MREKNFSNALGTRDTLQSTYKIKHYYDIFKIINEKHLSHTENWLAKQNEIIYYNLRKTEVRTIYDIKAGIPYIDPNFHQYVLNYRQSLMQLYADITSEIRNSCNLLIKGRIKNEDSIILKLHKKRNEQNGSFSLNKVLNDLLGFRIIDANFAENIHKVIPLLDCLKHKSGYRLIYKSRQNGNYKGFHIYFMGKNTKYFPIELQIWDAKDERMNLESHKIYKKEYTSWPELYHNG